jgi:hypothetical protein
LLIAPAPATGCPGPPSPGPFTNQIPIQYLPLGSLLTSNLERDHACAGAGDVPEYPIPFPNFTGTIGQALKPFPQYNGISDPWLDVGNSTYNALQVSLNHRFANGLSFMINYTFSKELDDLAGVRDPNKDYLEKGARHHRSPARCRRHIPLPVALRQGDITGQREQSGELHGSATGSFRNFHLHQRSAADDHRHLHGRRHYRRVLLSELQPELQGSVWQNGSIGSGGANVATTPYLNKAAFVDPANYTAGDIARTAPLGLFAPHNADFDLSVRREFPIRERYPAGVSGGCLQCQQRGPFRRSGNGDRFRQLRDLSRRWRISRASCSSVRLSF